MITRTEHSRLRPELMRPTALPKLVKVVTHVIAGKLHGRGWQDATAVMGAVSGFSTLPDELQVQREGQFWSATSRMIEVGLLSIRVTLALKHSDTIDVFTAEMSGEYADLYHAQLHKKISAATRNEFSDCRPSFRWEPLLIALSERGAAIVERMKVNGPGEFNAALGSTVEPTVIWTDVDSEGRD